MHSKPVSLHRHTTATGSAADTSDDDAADTDTRDPRFQSPLLRGQRAHWTRVLPLLLLLLLLQSRRVAPAVRRCPHDRQPSHRMPVSFHRHTTTTGSTADTSDDAADTDTRDPRSQSPLLRGQRAHWMRVLPLLLQSRRVVAPAVRRCPHHRTRRTRRTRLTGTRPPDGGALLHLDYPLDAAEFPA
jgi:hypothetical protein